MRYSVWNPERRSYDYYEAHGDAATHAGAPPRAASSALGATPEQAAWPLPDDARKVGSGELPQGRIASREPRGIHLDLTQSIFYGIVGYALWKVLR